MSKRLRVLLLPALLLGLGQAAQAAELRGRAVDAETGAPVQVVNVSLLRADGTLLMTMLGDAQGRFHFDQIEEADVGIRLSRLGYEELRREMIALQPSGGDELVFELTRRPTMEVPIVVSASRLPETNMNAPNSVSVIHRRDIEDRQSLTVIDAIQRETGVSYSRKGLMDATWRVRGTGGQLVNIPNLVIQDWRPTRMSGFTYNIPYLISATTADVERIELVRGETGGIYGPDSGGAVIHIMTHSPFDRAGTSISVGGGEQSLRETWARHSGVLGSKLGYKLSARYMRGDDWPVDSSTLIDEDPEIEQLNGQFALEWRPDDEMQFHFVGGRAAGRDLLHQFPGTYVHLGELRASFLQARFHRRNMLVNLVFNSNHTEDAFFLPFNIPIAEKSKFYGLQTHDGRDIRVGGVLNRIAYGIDTRTTRIRTDGTLTGRFEDNDSVSQLGAFVQSTAFLTDQWSLFGSIRSDYHDRLDNGLVFPARLGGIFKPNESHSFRLQAGRAADEGGIAFLFEDLPTAFVGGYWMDRVGIPKSGWNFVRDANGDLLMRSSYVPGGVQDFGTADATRTWGSLQGSYPALAGVPAPSAAQVGSDVRIWNSSLGMFESIDPRDVENVEQLRRSYEDRLEFAYTGWLGDRLFVDAAFYLAHREYVSGARVVTPSLFFDEAELESYLAGFMAPSEAADLAAAMANAPVGTIAPREAGASDRLILSATDVKDPQTRRGLALGANYRWPSGWGMAGSYQWSAPLRRQGESQPTATIPNQGKLRLFYDSLGPGLRASIEARAQEAHYQSIAGFVGFIEGFAEVNLNLAYEFAWQPRTTLHLNGTNILDEEHVEVYGGKLLGRLITARVQVDF